MMNKKKTLSNSRNELIFQLILHFVVFVFYGFEGRDAEFQPNQIVFFLNYSIAAAVINYALLPRYFYKKKYVEFTVLVTLLLGIVVLIEEMVLEPLLLPGSVRASSFNNIFYTLADVLPVITILSGFKFAWDAISKQKEVENLQATVRESELQFLKSQINPHFLFNNLNNLYSYAIAKSPETPNIILNLSGVLRYMLYECKEKYVPLSKEISQLEDFTKLYQLQIEERGAVEFKKKDISSEHMIAPLILPVFVENAFKHSQAGQTENIDICIDISMEGDTLDFYCRNNYQHTDNVAGIDNGIGLENVKKRLELLYPDAHILEFDTEGDQYIVRLKMNLRKMKD